MPHPSFFAAWRDENQATRPSRRHYLSGRRPLATRSTRTARSARFNRNGRRGGALALSAVVVATGVSLVHGSSASADPSANTWYRLRMCESGNNYSINTGNAHYGAYQFDLATWHGVGGSGYPQLASPAEQDARALVLYRLRGWQPWQCAGTLGLREDSDAGTGVTSDITVPTSGGSSGGGTSTVPTSGYTVGDSNATIARFQKQMGTRGASLVGTGQFGPKTLAVVRKLQRLNGRAVTGRLDRATYNLAFHGRYQAAGATPTVPPFPRGVTYGYGNRNSVIATFQRRMGSRGAPLVGTGQYGPKTVAVVKRLQAANGLRANGHLGPRTFRLAWVGRY